MSLFVVDRDKCSQCGVCVAVCPAGLVRRNGVQPVPVPADGADERCFACGHCVAACPSGAFSHGMATPEQCLPIRDDWRVGPEQAAQWLRSRRSIRNYQDKAVARETLAGLLDIVRFAPSGCNAQPVHWLVIHDTGQVRQLSGLVIDGIRNLLQLDPESALRDVLKSLVTAWDSGVDVVSRGAPHLIVAHGPGADPLALSAGIIAQTYLELAASASGLGACWMGLVDMTAHTWPPVRQFLGLPPGHVVLATLAVGYPQFRYVRIPPRRALRVTWR